MQDQWLILNHTQTVRIITPPYKNEVIEIIIDISTDKKHFTVINDFCHIAQPYVHYFVVFKRYAGNIKILGNLK